MPTNYILVTYKNVEGHGYMPLDFTASTKALFNLRVLVAKGSTTNLGGGRRIVSGPIFEKMRVATVVGTYELYPHQVSSTFWHVCPHSHYILVGERPTWKFTLI